MNRILAAITATAGLAILLTGCTNPAPPLSDVEQTTTPMTQDTELHFDMPHIELADGPMNQLTLETTVIGDAANANISLDTTAQRTYVATGVDGRQAAFVHHGAREELDTIDLPGLTSVTTAITLPVTVDGFASTEGLCVGAAAVLIEDEVALCALDALGIASTADLASVELGPLTLKLSRNFSLGNGTAQVCFSDQGAAP
ncbi:hypothetical protein C5E06_09785 [Pseudoclavibacter sp. RFBI5]|uniref:hypothetical protein n=1 Tax=Pseudoclavibacter sp. RFBI5 TaxID=2080578 RepID=UPI000CE86D9C|nr:hypothetical protein [Pseudoclavibacter sp. RFBI5]PPG02734.1 hypothetical protein C5E06_09785 [Pseudoclavibacter sp. RFBI5]